MHLSFAFNLTDIGLVITLVILFLILLAVTIRFFSGLMVLLLLVHNLGACILGTLNGLEVLVLMMLDLLQMRYDQSVVGLLLFLHLCVEVLDLSLELLDLLTGVLIKVMDHVFLDLESVSLHLRVLQFLSQGLNRDLELLTAHSEVLIFGLGLLLLSSPLSLLTFLAFSSHSI